MASTRAIDVPPEQKNKTLASSYSSVSDNLSFTPTTSNLRRTQFTNQELPPASATQSHHPLHLILEQEPLFPQPLSPDKCPLFCCFYAEFDIKVGPKVCFQSPHGFMDKDMSLPTETMHDILAKTFEVMRSQETGSLTTEATADDLTDDTMGMSGSDHSGNPKQNLSSTTEGTLSIFDSTSEYIITGNELAGKIINMSTHYMHILTRPTVISNEQYERNSLLFSVGFVLRRAEDPRTFRPLLSKWASTLRSMEVESNFLTDPSTRNQIQPMLDRLLINLNSAKSECHLLLNKANLLSFRRFRPPKPPASPVPDHAVPILLRRDWELHLYDWDLAINWVVMHIDGVANAKQISKKSEVDMEMVRACLRVLKHHGVIALVDMFFYSNRYEFTERATAMLAGKEPELLQQAIEYIVKVPVDSSRHSEPVSHEYVRASEGIPGPTFSSRSPVSSFPPAPDRLSRAAMRGIPTVRDTEAHRNDNMLRSAIAELHCACTRNISFSDLWVSLIMSSSRARSKHEGTARGERNNQSRFGSLQWSSRRELSGFSDYTESGTLSPSDLGYMDKSRGQLFARNNIDWKTVFGMFDHRRWAIFAVVHGLLRRVHNYPLVLDLDGSNEKKGSNYHSVQANDNGYLRARDEDQTQLAGDIAAMMDGTHSDDEIVTEFNLPIEKIFHIVKSRGVRFVYSVYSTAPSGH